MSKFVSAEDKVFARKVDLFGFLLKNYPDAVKVEQNSLRLKANRSITIKRGYCGYTDWATSETGNSIDMLMRYFGYSFVDAVAALCEFAGRFSYPQSRLHSLPQPDRTKAVEASAPKDDTFVLPKRDPGRYSRLFAYLNKKSRQATPSLSMLTNRSSKFAVLIHKSSFIRPGTGQIGKVTTGRSMPRVRVQSLPLHTSARER